MCQRRQEENEHEDGDDDGDGDDDVMAMGMALAMGQCSFVARGNFPLAPHTIYLNASPI